MAYITKQGDTWDNIALEVYGDEICADYLMQNNYRYLDIVIFDSGVVLNTPELPEISMEEGPPWRTMDDMMEDPYDDYSDEEELF